MRLLKISSLLLLATAIVSPVHAEARYEQQVINSVEDLAKADMQNSLQSLEQLIKNYPNSKLGHLVMADLLAMRAGAPDLVKQYDDDTLQLSGLRDELTHRWMTHKAQTPASRGLIPVNLITSAPTERYVLAADANHSRLYIFENVGTSYQLVADYFMTIGKQGMGKNKEGDLRTPEGVYHVTSYLPGEGLPDRYGPGAFPINYPNEYDKQLQRTGYGIWIHGTESENYNRVPLASDGCLSLSNDEFLEIQQYISTDGSTPVIISKKFDWVDPQQRQSVSDPAMEIIDRWKSDWESLDTDRFLAHYSPSQFKNYKQFSQRKHQVNRAKDFIEIDLNNVSVYVYPGKHKMMMVTFDQEYRSDNHHSVTQKKQYWMQQGNKWQIIYEG